MAATKADSVPEQDTPGRREVDAAIGGGRFASKQIYGKAWLISWGHRQRFKVGLELARGFAGRRVCDYGCGDGTFLAMLMKSATPPASALGVERSEPVIDDCRRRLGDVPGLSFAGAGERGVPEASRGFDAVFCMEVLEHVLDLDRVFGHLHDLLAPEGTLIVSVPVETGLPLILKQTARRIAGLRGIQGYVGHSGYTWRELLAAVTAGPETKVPRIIHGGDGAGGFYDHKGFNWMAMREAIAAKFTLEETLSSPFRWLPPGMGSQVWFVARRRPAPAGGET